MALILLADDVAMARDALARVLRDRGHKVIVVGDGQEAVDRAQRERPDLAILDVNMPRLTGIDACSRIKALPGALVPVLLMSARSDLDSRLACLAVGDDFIPKPYEATELCARVDIWLRTRRTIEDLRRLADPSAAEAGQPASLLDREAFNARLDEEWRRSARSTDPLAVLVAGVDHLEATSASGQHAALLILGSTMQRCLRNIDVVAHSDDKHVAALLLNTHVTGTMAAIERLKRELRKLLVDGKPPVVSMGVSFHPGREVTEPSDLLRVAEYALSRAREHAAGAVCLYQNQGYIYTLD